MKKKIIMIGAGGYSKSVIDSLDKEENELIGFIDEKKRGEHLNYKILGNNLEDLKKNKEYHYFISIGDNKSRKIWFERLNEKNLDIINIIDKSAIVSKDIIIGKGIFIGKLSVVNRGAIIEDNTIINTRAVIEHGVIVSKNANISTNTVLNGDVFIGEESFIGSCSVINGQIKVGKNSIIGSGSVVIKDVPQNVVIAGVPAKFIRSVN